MSTAAWGLVALSLAALPSLAHADPCEAIRERGPAPFWVKRGAVFSGQVRYVGDGDGLCVGALPDPRTWIEVRLTDFYAPELSTPEGRAAHRALTDLAMGQQATCTIEGGKGDRVRSYDRVLAVCRVRGRSLGESMRKLSVEGGNGSPGPRR